MHIMKYCSDPGLDVRYMPKCLHWSGILLYLVNAYAYINSYSVCIFFCINIIFIFIINFLSMRIALFL